jgi:hypothetical protein
MLSTFRYAPKAFRKVNIAEAIPFSNLAAIQQERA